MVITLRVRVMQDIYFTAKVATELAFCNRVEEQKILNHNMKCNQHTVIVAPRRYGKTSLVLHTLNRFKYTFARVDLFCVVYEEDVCRKVAAAVSAVIRRISTFSEKTIKLVEQSFKSASIGLKAGHIELSVQFGKTDADPISQLEDLLNGLEVLAQKHKKPVVLFFDEFQDVLKVDETNKLQAAIRAVAQHSKFVTYIFSGSSRMMLNKIFDDKNQPLYMLCKKIILERISSRDFRNHIQKAAEAKWKKQLNGGLVTQILSHTENHPYYTNLLCDKLWESDTPPSEEAITECWDTALFENKGKVISDLEPLNSNRTKVLSMVALLGSVNEPNSKIFLDKVKLPLASTQHAVKYLMNHDYLYESEDGLKLVDPLMRKFIIKQYKPKYDD